MSEATPTRNIDQQPSLLMNWLGLLINPSLAAHAVAETLTAFVATRPWRRVLWFSPALILLLAVFSIIVYGRVLSREALVERYASLAEAELARLKAEQPKEKSDEKPETLLESEAASEFSDMLYRRLLQLNDGSAHTRYVVAHQLMRSNRVSQARRLMEVIAPLNSSGYPPAHAWLVVDLLTNNTGENEQERKQKLLIHFEGAKSWEGTSGKLLAVYADLLLRDGKKQEAMDIMSLAAKRDTSMEVVQADLARRLDMKKIAQEVAVSARAKLQEAVKQPDAKLENYVELIALEISEKRHQAAFEMARTALARIDRNSPKLRMLASEALRLMYRDSIRQTPTGIELNLNLLDAAMKEFPGNPNLAAEIALLDDMGAKATPEMKAKMEEQLANGQATALAHLILANQNIKAGKLVAAIPHLELTLKGAENHPVALNNLALCLAMTDTAQLERAEKLIATAVTIDPNNPEYWDSQGQIRLIAKRPLDAISSLEKAIGLDPNRVATRQLMVEAYRSAGLEDLAQTQQKLLDAALKTKAAQEEQLKQVQDALKP